MLKRISLGELKNLPPEKQLEKLTKMQQKMLEDAKTRPTMKPASFVPKIISEEVKRKLDTISTVYSEYCRYYLLFFNNYN